MPTPTNLPTLASLLQANSVWLLGAVDTKEAAEITGVPVATLVTLRSTGGGPRFFLPTLRSVRYLRIDLYEWMLAGGLKSNTADVGTQIDLRSTLLEDGATNE